MIQAKVKVIWLLVFFIIGKGSIFPDWRQEPIDPDRIIFIVVDALRADHLSAYGYERKTTPNIDSLISNALICKNAFSQSNQTPASMASLFTGTYPLVHKIYNPPEEIQDRYSILPEKLTIIPEVLKANGFYTVAISACGWVSPHSNYGQGFDEFNLIERDDQLIINKAIRFIKNKKEEKYFLYLHLLDLHDYSWLKPDQSQFIQAPYDLSKVISSNFFKTTAETYRALGRIGKKDNLTSDDLRYLIDLYDSELYYTDQLIGNLVNTLEEERLLDHTLIIITADHGERFMEHGRLLHGGNLLYTEDVWIPLIFHNRSLFPKTTTITSPVSSIDVFPTLLDIFSMENVLLDGMNQLQGNSLFKTTANNVIFIESSSKKKFKLIKGNWSLVYDKDARTSELFNLEADSSETKNLAPERKKTVTEMEDILRKLIKESLGLSEKISPEDAVMDEKIREMLRSIGYIK